MTVYITLPTRLNWSQRMATELDSLAVGMRMERIACNEAARLGGKSVEVRATDDQGNGWRILRWPSDGLSYWVFAPTLFSVPRKEAG